MANDLERRAEAAPETSGNFITGHAARFNSPAIIAGAFREFLRPGCFSRSLRETPDVLALLHHDPGRILGRVSAGTLQLREDAQGLRFELEADPSTPDGQTAIGTVSRRDIKGCSIGFRVVEEDWDTDGAGFPVRTILDVDLLEMSLVGWPAYESTNAEMVKQRNANGAAERLRRKAEAAMRLRGIL
ncbi:phage prohead protease, HK97 family [Ancylobacter novellus DSM 506]|uniref:Phage prohead protease, HK97 family n=1 Tax=Ancylobacter novellus (strain ATCC 8093 / DSM 506 / JCM 20403 / CCM 1077 / IAM 12100 / NBRC 12443 / NCIMB 10456) TaxID=639283 RepID=D7A2T9_ANCN5|nr:HK97 family phage prohead protease [Ancylobacter novellus]ADH91619.1 phage prohead protease, HK97 family [Ancylobacter novellus DSM 506]